MIKLATVSPCYNEEPVLEDSIKKLTEFFDGLVAKGKISEDSMMLFVNDGSKDHTWDIISKMNKENHYVRGISLAHNSGHPLS